MSYKTVKRVASIAYCSLHWLISEAVQQTVDQECRYPVEEERCQVVLPAGTFHRAARVPQHTVQRDLVRDDPFAPLDDTFPGDFDLGRAHQVIDVALVIPKEKERTFGKFASLIIPPQLH